MFLVTRDYYDFPRETIIGLFSTIELAKKAARNFTKRTRNASDGSCGSINIHCCFLDGERSRIQTICQGDVNEHTGHIMWSTITNVSEPDLLETFAYAILKKDPVACDMARDILKM